MPNMVGCNTWHEWWQPFVLEKIRRKLEDGNIRKIFR